jgi:hypothetical protein
MRRTKIWLVVGLASFLLASCAYMQGDKEIEDPTDIKKGPGIFTGRSGEWVILKK